MTGQDRRRIATRILADTTGIGFGSVRRPTSALTCPRGHAHSQINHLVLATTTDGARR